MNRREDSLPYLILQRLVVRKFLELAPEYPAVPSQVRSSNPVHSTHLRRRRTLDNFQGTHRLLRL